MINKGTYIADRYEILEKIGVGGMADVYKAQDHKLERPVAIKVLKPEFSSDMNFVTKFRTEAQSAAGLEHPNIVNVYDVGTENGSYYIVMEYVEGITLKDYIQKKGRLNYKEALSIAIQVSRGIQAAHAKNIIHRDIKPQNIIISNDGKVKVTDFGIARAATSNTIHSDVMGSVHYASPEQARNGYVSARSDIYSLGIVMYEMVTGKVPFDGESTVQIAIQHLQDEMEPPHVYAPDLPISLEKIIQKCTQKSPDRRYDSMESLLIDLRKSLLHPNEDFVTMPSVNDATRVISEEELKKIQDRTDKVKKNPEPEAVPAKAAPADVPEKEEEDGRKHGFLSKRTEKIITIAGIVAAIVIILIVILLLGRIFGWFDHSSANSAPQQTTSSSVSEPENDTVDVTDLTGMTVDQARAELKQRGLKLKQASTKASDDYDSGEIISQTPKAGTSVQKGDTIRVVVSSGSSGKEETVPSVIGLTEKEAVTALEAHNFTVNKEYEYSDGVGTGEVFSQSPNANTTAASGTSVTIKISKGSERVEVPDVEGKTVSEAKKTLKASGLKSSVEREYSSSVPKGEVISQSTSSGEYVSRSTVITLTVSRGPRQQIYSYRTEIERPDDISENDFVEADIRIMDKDGKVLKSYKNVTEFPYTVYVTNIEGSSSGTMQIKWHDSDGNRLKDTEERQVTFTKASD